MVYIAAHYEDGALYFIYLTNWTYLLTIVYSLWAAVSVSMSHLTVFWCQKHMYQQEPNEGGPCSNELLIDDRPLGCCGCTSDNTRWHQKILWVLYSTTTTVSILMCISYWIFQYSFNYDKDIGFYSIASHVLVGSISLMDMCVTGIPLRLLHVIYPIGFGLAYVFFTAAYYAAGGAGVDGSGYIYSVLNYKEKPSEATLIIFGVLVIGVIFHSILCGLYLARELVICLIRRYCFCCFPCQCHNSLASVGEVTELRGDDNSSKTKYYIHL